MELTMVKCSKDTRQQLKVLAAKAGMTMQAYLEKLVRRANYEVLKVVEESAEVETEEGARQVDRKIKAPESISSKLPA